MPRPRKRKTQSAVAFDSTKGISISDILANQSQISPRPDVSHQVEQNGTSKEHIAYKPGTTYAGGQSLACAFKQSVDLDPSVVQLLHGIDCNCVQRSFVIFRQMMPFFPFVTLRPDSEPSNMISSRPMTTMAICVVTLPANKELQDRLCKAFRQALASKVIVGAERSLDLMVGLLIWIAWHHQYMYKQQIYQELCLLAGMAADMGLYNGASMTMDADEAVERNRAFVGCYYLCCNLSMVAFNKPSPMRWTDELHRLAEELALAARIPQDTALIGTLELVHAMQDLEDDFRAQKVFKRSTGAHYIELLVKTGHQHLKTLRREHPTLAGTLGFAAATIHLHHRFLKCSESPDSATLIQCTCAIKDYLDDVLARPPITLHRVNIIEWTNVLEILILMARVSKPLPQAAGWEAGAVSSMLQPEVLLETVCTHMGSVPPNDLLAPRIECTYEWFTRVCTGIKKRILQERGIGGASGLRNDDANFDQLGSLGSFRPVNDANAFPSQHSKMMEPETPTMPACDLDSIDFFGAGVLDDDFWDSFMW
ncbi:Hypothetical protein R9X50_00253000 [Acrodontium crateriforme]|uniref:Transcription factor domain-containing protein n=1 Tax=Acrodontium crateriforme TaxID=150365 RepID=A0AAQ3M131_9PEZI|nr:Hypothetical protein R9X50_00253000 [Acrodontium crateriforme]